MRTDLSTFFDWTFDKRNLPAELKQEIINESDKSIVILDVPGFNKDEISIEIEENDIIIKGKREAKEHLGEKEFTKVFKASPSVNIENISAKLENGQLIVIAPKKEKQKTIVQIE